MSPKDGEQTSSTLAFGWVDIAFGADGLDFPLRAERMQAANADAADLLGDARVEAQLAVAGLEAEHRLYEDERGCSGPCLRAAGRRVRNGKWADPAFEARERLRKPVAREGGRLQLRQRDPVRVVAKACARESQGDDCVVVRPDRADVVADRVVAAIVGRERADAPAREHRVRHELSGDDTRALRRNDPRPEQVPDVGGHGVDPALVSVEADDVIAAAVLGPEVVVEASVQLFGLALEALSKPDVGAEAPRKLGDAQFRVVDVALNLRG